MTTRTLPPEEWPRLAGTEAEMVWPLLNPATATVVVVEDAGAIVGCWVLMPVLHAECLWIAESHRAKTAVPRRLLTGMLAAARRLGVGGVVTASISATVDRLLERVGAQALPGRHFVWNLGGSEVCRQLSR